MRMNRLIGIVTALAATGCGQSLTVGNSAAKGSVGGVVLDAAPGLQPLMGAQVTVVAGGASLAATTDANGVFSVGDVPSGSVIVKLQAMGHFDVYLTANLPAAVGNF